MSASGPRLAGLTRELLVRWQQTREYWMDAKAREFENRFITELESTVNSALPSIAQIEGALRKIRSDCE